MIADLNNYNDIEYLVLMSINTNRNKYWADDDFGSDLFLLKKSKISKSTAADVKRMIEESLAWLVDDKIAKAVNVETFANEKKRINWKVEIIKPDTYGNIIEGVWKEYANA